MIVLRPAVDILPGREIERAVGDFERIALGGGMLSAVFARSIGGR